MAPEPPLAVPEAGLGVGDKRRAVAALERRLDALRYDVGAVDDLFDADTGYGVTAFQKVARPAPHRRATPDVAERLATAQPPARHRRRPAGPPGSRSTCPTRCSSSTRAAPSTGSCPSPPAPARTTASTEDCGTAVTPPGSYKVDYHVDGWDSGPLGDLYNPVYFDPENGLAIHGSEEVPADPASHGCVRISMAAAEWFPDKAPKGTPVYVSDGQTALQPV